MSARTLRRAAERQARKAERKLNQLNTQSTQAEPVVAAHPEPETDQTEDLTADLELHDILETPPTEQPKTRPATEAQINANRENAKGSHGPVTPEGKAAVSQNRRSHGLAGKFILLSTENAENLQILARSVYEEHKPETDTEQRFVDSIIQHYWLMQRAIHMQEELIARADHPTEVDDKRLSLFLRYQSTHERSYYKALRELQNLKKQKQKDDIGFEFIHTHKNEQHTENKNDRCN
jgi:hypothetical protein